MVVSRYFSRLWLRAVNLYLQTENRRVPFEVGFVQRVEGRFVPFADGSGGEVVLAIPLPSRVSYDRKPLSICPPEKP